ncbi:hypothetical protein BX666DRAFT_2029523 [Dichotomocladium elegans]|nr:hypothetical protein BX666DRAFT_2029523 [Dichotomocladium elegans]
MDNLATHSQHSTADQPSPAAQFNELVAQVAQQQAIIQQLLHSQGIQVPSVQSDNTASLHDLPTRPRYDWCPAQLLRELIPTLDHLVFGQPLDDEDRKTIVERYPPMAGVSYSPPSTLPEAERHFNRGHKHEDASLRSMQYATSAILRPLDVLAHSLLPMLPPDQIGRIFAIINDVRTLVLHVGGVANNARNNIAMRAVNPSFTLPTSEKQYTMSLDQFRDTVSAQTTMRKTLKEARPALPSAFFRDDPQQQHSTQPRQPQQQLRQQPTGTIQQPLPSDCPPRRRRLPVGGRLQQFSRAWMRLTDSTWVHSVIREGFRIHFRRSPPLSTKAFSTNPRNHDQRQLLRQEIAQLLYKRAIEPAPASAGFTSSMFVIDKNIAVTDRFSTWAEWEYSTPHFQSDLDGAPIMLQT